MPLEKSKSLLLLLRLLLHMKSYRSTLLHFQLMAENRTVVQWNLNNDISSGRKVLLLIHENFFWNIFLMGRWSPEVLHIDVLPNNFVQTFCLTFGSKTFCMTVRLKVYLFSTRDITLSHLFVIWIDWSRDQIVIN